MDSLEEIAKQLKDFRGEAAKQVKELRTEIAELRKTQEKILAALNIPAGVPAAVPRRAPEEEEEHAPFLAYCSQCFERRPVVDPAQVTLADGSLATQGKCAACGAVIFRMATMTGVLITDAASQRPGMRDRKKEKREE
ncbi:MAG: hypothetical protein IBX68_09315 [Dehalococcoidia bacterium]|nr:hypothetical protein [Dehalococcoidia bacterium]